MTEVVWSSARAVLYVCMSVCVYVMSAAERVVLHTRDTSELRAGEVRHVSQQASPSIGALEIAAKEP